MLLPLLQNLQVPPTPYAPSFEYENTIRKHDVAVATWLQGIKVDYGTIAGVARNNVPILLTMATPQRAWAAMRNVLVKTGWIAGATPSDQRTAADALADIGVLPFCTMERFDPTLDPELAGVPKRLDEGAYNQVTGQWDAHEWPGAYRVRYSATFWMLKRYTEAFLREWFMSQIGKRGALAGELFIPVAHEDPHGTHRQSLKVDATTDLSELEGEEQRYIRFEVELDLRLLHFRPVAASAEDIAVVNASKVFAGLGDDAIPLSSQPAISDRNPSRSFNFFNLYARGDDIASEWIVAGNGTASEAEVAPDGFDPVETLEVFVEEATDQVDIANRPVYLDSSTRAILSCSFQYLATAPVDLVVHQHTGQNKIPIWIQIQREQLPFASVWTKKHFFALATETIVDISVQGKGPPSTARFADIDIFHVLTQTNLSPTSTQAVTGGTKYIWQQLEAAMYLAVVIPGTTGSVWTPLVFADDQSIPNAIPTKVTLDTTVQAAAVVPVRAKTDSIAVTLPTGFPSPTLYIQRHFPGLDL